MPRKRCPRGTYPVVIRKNGKREGACAEITKAQARKIRKLRSEIKKKTRSAKISSRNMNTILALDAMRAALSALT